MAYRKAPYTIMLLNFASCGEVGLDLSYEVTISETGHTDVEIAVVGVAERELDLKTYEHPKYLGLSDIEATTDRGLLLKILESETEAGPSVFTVSANGAEDVNVRYSVKPGHPIGGGHGRHPTSLSGYMGRDFGLVSGRNLFVVPNTQLDSISVRIKAPAGWAVVTTWNRRNEESNEFYPHVFNNGPEDLLNATVGVGALRVYERMVVGTPLRVAVYDGWSDDYKKELIRRVSDLYGYATGVMEAPITEAYTVILTPKTMDGFDIRTFGTSHGQGREMWPPTTDRWIAVTEQMMYRWLRYAPFRMELARMEDMWFVDGAAVYYALLGTYETGIAESITPYLDEAYRQYNSTRLTQYTGGVVPATLYAKSTPGMRALRTQWGLMLAHFIDESIGQATDEAADLRHVLRRGYQQRRDVDLARITKESTGLDIGHLRSTVIEPGFPPQTPLWYQETHPPGTRPRELPRTRGSRTAQDTLTLILTGRTQSFLEACGCKSNMSGGITRRATLLDQIRQRRDNALVIDSGDLFPDIRDVPEMDDLTSTEIDTYLESLVRMGYGFAAIAGNEVSYGPEFLKSKVENSPIPMISANVLHHGTPIAPPTIVLEVGRHRFGFIGLLQERVDIQQSAFSDNTWDVEIADPMSALRRHLGELREEVDFVGVVGGMHTELVFEIAEEFPGLDLLVTTGHDYPSVDILRDGQISNSKDQMYGFLGRTLVLYANADVYGIHSFDVGIDESNEFVSVDGSRMDVLRQIPEDPAMSAFLEGYYRDVAENSSLLGWDSQPLFEWDMIHQEREYVGSNACASCHPGQNEHWFQTDHANAYGTLLDVHRHQFPKCVKCHVAGLGRPTGFSILEPKRELADVQCEVCHGPGSQHVKVTTASTIRKTPSEETCIECHNSDHDDDFSYERDFELVRH